MISAMNDGIFLKNLLAFAGIFLVVFIVCLVILSSLGFIPTEFQREVYDDSVAARIEESTLKGLGLVASTSMKAQPPKKIKGELPYRLVASSIGLDTPVVRPASADYTLLNDGLARGAVYYPGSGLNGSGNMFIFGHSTSYKYVNNKAYQVFNNIKDLKEGDEIKVYGQDKIYAYKVREVKLVNANQELVSFSYDKNLLTLSTCNSFGQKTDRYVVEADFVAATPL